ncbi:MAG: proteasome-activating nucleotidase, partial [Methanomassiliicoccaceae archaeon]|nr:proteasome-activating nucleotidase [Methanomassiliicoccaceae archaeon]
MKETYEELMSELKEKIISLEDRNRRLAEEMNSAEAERRSADSELFRAQKELKRLKTEMERLRSPPLIIGTLRDLLSDNRVVVKSSTGPDFIVSVSEYIPKDDLIPGSRVSMNKQTLAVMDVLPAPLDPVVT